MGASANNERILFESVRDKLKRYNCKYKRCSNSNLVSNDELKLLLQLFNSVASRHVTKDEKFGIEKA